MIVTAVIRVVIPEGACLAGAVLNARGQGLKAGEVVTTGSYAGIVDAPVGVPAARSPRRPGRDRGRIDYRTPGNLC